MKGTEEKIPTYQHVLTLTNDLSDLWELLLLFIFEVYFLSMTDNSYCMKRVCLLHKVL